MAVNIQANADLAGQALSDLVNAIDQVLEIDYLGATIQQVVDLTASASCRTAILVVT